MTESLTDNVSESPINSRRETENNSTKSPMEYFPVPCMRRSFLLLFVRKLWSLPFSFPFDAQVVVSTTHKAKGREWRFKNR